MKISTFASLKAVTSLETNVKSTEELMTSIHANIIGMNYFVKKSQNKSENRVKMEKTIQKSMEGIPVVFKMGFIAMYANWEYFMFDALKEIISNYPKCLNSENSIKIHEIEGVSSIDELNMYISDKFATEYSYTIDAFCGFLSKKVRLKVLLSEEKELLEMMGLIRNAYLHSGSKVNSIFSKKMGKILEIKVPINDDIDINPEKLFRNLNDGILNFVKRIKKRRSS